MAADIGAGLAKAALAGKVDGRMVDTSYTIDRDADLAIITGKSDEALELIRHDAAHVMAQAVQELYPGTQVTMAGDRGWFTTTSRATSRSRRPICRRSRIACARSSVAICRSSARSGTASRRRRRSATSARTTRSDHRGHHPGGEEVSIYRQGDWFDVCRGPHLPSTGKLPKAFKLMNWPAPTGAAIQQPDAAAHLRHRVAQQGRTQGLPAPAGGGREARPPQDRQGPRPVSSQDEAPGMVFWHNRGWTIYLTVQQYIRDKLRDHGYQEVHTLR